jgi:hypothetical protein
VSELKYLPKVHSLINVMLSEKQLKLGHNQCM